MRPRLRRLIFLLLCAATVLRADDGAEVEMNPYDPLVGAPAPLAAAIRQFGRDANRWACTQRVVQYDRKGGIKSEWVARHDPSLHYDEQWTLLQRDGAAPTEAQQRKFRRERAKREKNRQTLGELLELRQAVPVRETDTAFVYEVPLRREAGSRFPPEKFEVFVTVAKDGPALDLIEVRLRERFRVGVVVNVKQGDARLAFTRVLPEAGPAMTEIHAGGTASVLLVPVGGRVELTRTDLKRVTPYDERFNVKLGPLKAIDF